MGRARVYKACFDRGQREAHRGPLVEDREKKGRGFVITQCVRYAFKKKIRDYLGIFPNMGGGLPNSQNSKPKKKCP